MSDKDKDISAHEIANSLNNIFKTMRAGIDSGELKVILGKAPAGDPMMVLEWPNCPMYGTTTAYFGPKDMENYAHINNAWDHMRAPTAADLPPTHTPTVPSDTTLKAAMAAFAKGQVMCPVTGSVQSRIYDYVFSVQSNGAAQFKLLVCTADTRWAVSFEMSLSTKISITDVETKIVKEDKTA